MQWVQFADFDPSWTPPDWDDTGRTHNSIGLHGPEGVGSFCLTHFDRAMQLRRLTVADAVARLQAEPTPTAIIGSDLYPEGASFGPFRLLRLLGRGDLATVYEAEHTAKRVTVALKVISARWSQDPMFRMRMQRNVPAVARAVQRASEPHIVPIIDWGEIDERPYIEMPVVYGTNLQQVLTRIGRMDPVQAVDLLDQVGAALDALHSQELLHLNIRADNILLGRNLTLLLFGFRHLVNKLAIGSI